MSLVPDEIEGTGFFTPMDIAPGEYEIVNPKEETIMTDLLIIFLLLNTTLLTAAVLLASIRFWRS